ncbi:MAG: hypothetical protein ACETWM_16815 [Candidatus Lokiarchaeia archaeon]
MPIDKRDLLFLSQIPFQLSGEEHLSPSKWCFCLSFNWGIHKGILPSIAQKILTLALEEKIIEKQNETLTIKETGKFPPLYKFDKKIEPKELKDVKPYPIKSKIEYNEVKLQTQQEKTVKKQKEKEKPIDSAQESEKRSQIKKEEIKGEKPREELKEEKTKKKTKITKKQKPKKDEPELTLDHFTKT